jgi:hypothetical protein
LLHCSCLAWGCCAIECMSPEWSVTMSIEA